MYAIENNFRTRSGWRAVTVGPGRLRTHRLRRDLQGHGIPQATPERPVRRARGVPCRSPLTARGELTAATLPTHERPTILPAPRRRGRKHCRVLRSSRRAGRPVRAGQLRGGPPRGAAPAARRACPRPGRGRGHRAGRAALAARGYRCVAAEPTAELRAHGERIHGTRTVHWVDDALPELPLHRHPGRFDGRTETACGFPEGASTSSAGAADAALGGVPRHRAALPGGWRRGDARPASGTPADRRTRRCDGAVAPRVRSATPADRRTGREPLPGGSPGDRGPCGAGGRSPGTPEVSDTRTRCRRIRECWTCRA
ncbi:hypothetical protein SCALM49S_01809 [Streptomyces californicus]